MQVTPQGQASQFCLSHSTHNGPGILPPGPPRRTPEGKAVYLPPHPAPCSPQGSLFWFQFLGM